MACENCENGCINPDLCSCDCSTCAEGNACDIPVGDQGPQGPQGIQGEPGLNGTNRVDGDDGANGCSITNVYIAEGGEPLGDGLFAIQGDLIVETGEAPTPCGQTINAGNLITAFNDSDGGTEGGGSVPEGIIVMWSGTVNNIPTGWALCDGSQGGVPDLRGRFIVMADNIGQGPGPSVDSDGDLVYPTIGSTGGAIDTCLAKHNIPEHVHDLDSVDIDTDYSGAHYHKWRGWWRTDNDEPGNDWECKSRYRVGGDSMQNITAVPGDGTGDCSGDQDPDCGAHQHDITMTGVTGNGVQDGLNPGLFGECFTNLPPYYALAFIIKI